MQTIDKAANILAFVSTVTGYHRGAQKASMGAVRYARITSEPPLPQGGLKISTAIKPSLGNQPHRFLSTVPLLLVGHLR